MAATKRLGELWTLEAILEGLKRHHEGSHMAFDEVEVVGAGLAGCEAALQLARRGVPVRLVEMRPGVQTAVHEGGSFAQLVCSNSLKGTTPGSAANGIKEELSCMGSVLLECAKRAAIPAGGALAVDRKVFSALVERLIEQEPLITVERREVTSIPSGYAIIATGPLTSDALALELSAELGCDSLAFYDAAAPIIEADSIDREVVFAQSRYDKGGATDYLNAPFDKESYEAFVTELVAADRVIDKHFKRRELFAACQPVEEVARTGLDALRFGALKPVGLTDPRSGRRPWAAVQLRAENAQATAYNLVGFQTNLRFGEQQRVFRMIPGLEHAEFSRYGVMHRNTFVDTPHVLTKSLALPRRPKVHLAGQLTGTEGYLEAVASGLYVALNVYAQVSDMPGVILPKHSFLGALFDYATDPACEDYQPMHVNHGILEPIQPKIKNKTQRQLANAQRALDELSAYVTSRGDVFASAVSSAACRAEDL